MSKKIFSFPAVFASVLIILQFFTFSAAQDVDIRVKITVADQIRAEISGRFLDAAKAVKPREMWFLDDYAGIGGLAKRRSDVLIYDRWNYLIARRALSSTTRVRSDIVGGYRFTVDLTPLPSASAGAHVSWASGDVGLIMLDDIFPQTNAKTAKVTLELPTGWQVLGIDPQTGPNMFTFSNTEKAVFYIGRGIRNRQIRRSGPPLDLAMSGEWLFTDEEAVAMTTSIYTAYERLFGGLPDRAARVSLLKFPVASRPGAWEAETRGSTVTILSSDMPFKAQSIQRLHEQLRHEMFHLWIPNAVNLSGSYDWFYEGFAIYASLKHGVAANQIRFDDMLASLAQAYNIETLQPDKRSLVQASRDRWLGGNSRVYARGMLVAFLCDVRMMERSKGKRVIEDVIRDIYRGNPLTGERRDGNDTIVAALRSHAELVPLVERYITGAEPFDWSSELALAGIEQTGVSPGIKLNVTSKPTGRQKDLLDRLGYNNWRKLAGTLK
ncbi:MAG: hypothetical protein KA746_13210 [Pyrinomonadaceae bacterium]|nr:hypothetical protein [Pyrinomonadaceae bacterium]MBP6212657.1 hypothetical protein [Pyrinomonadaceae bacterium]